MRDGEPEVLAASDMVMQYATLTDRGLCEDTPNADTAKLPFALSVILKWFSHAGITHERWMAFQI